MATSHRYTVAIRALLVDDHRAFRAGMREILTQDGRICVVAEADDGKRAIQLARQHQPELIIMDVSMPGLSGIEATRQICRNCPHTKVLALSMHSCGRVVTEMLRAGAAGYMVKDADLEELFHAVRELVDCRRGYVSPRVRHVIAEEPAVPFSAHIRSAFSKLTSREKEVLQLITEGKTIKEAAGILGIRPKTAEAHRFHIMAKLRVDSMALLTKHAIMEGLTAPQVR